MHKYLVGVVQGAQSGKAAPAKKTVRVVRPAPSQSQSSDGSKSSPLTPRVELALFSCGTVALVWYLCAHLPSFHLSSHAGRGGFTSGFFWATVTCTAVAAIGARYLSNALSFGRDFTSYPAHVARQAHPTRPPAGVLIRDQYQKFKLIAKDELAKDIYRFTFALPEKYSVLGLPTGQHVAIRGYWDDGDDHHTVTRSYTPVSNNTDLGRLELVIRCYPDGKLTGKYLVNCNVGDQVEFRGPTGAMRYRKGYCKRLGMISGGTGITPMFQLIRAICEDKSDSTEVRLIYANRSESDILMRKALDRFSKESGGQFQVYYMLDKPEPGWKGGVGYCTKETIQEHLPAASNGKHSKHCLPSGCTGADHCADTKILLCGPPGMVNASKKNLVQLGFEAPGAVSKMSDQIFCF